MKRMWVWVSLSVINSLTLLWSSMVLFLVLLMPLIMAHLFSQKVLCINTTQRWDGNGMETNCSASLALYYYGICDESKQTLITQNNSETRVGAGVTTRAQIQPNASKAAKDTQHTNNTIYNTMQPTLLSLLSLLLPTEESSPNDKCLESNKHYK